MAESKKETKKNIYQKISNVMARVGKVEKKGYSIYMKYHYVEKDTLYDYLRKFLVDEGIALTTSMLEMNRGVVGTSKPQNSTELALKIELVNVDDPEDRIESIYYGLGMDSGDKDLYKALTGAMKYFLIDTFLISGGDSVQGDVEHDQPEAVKETGEFERILALFTPTQKKQLRQLWALKHLDTETFVNLGRNKKTAKEILDEVAKL